MTSKTKMHDAIVAAQTRRAEYAFYAEAILSGTNEKIRAWGSTRAAVEVSIYSQAGAYRPNCLKIYGPAE